MDKNGTIRANLKASKQLLKAFAPDFVQHWHAASAKAATRGDHRPAMDALERLRLVTPLPKPDPAPAVSPVQIHVGIGLPGVPVQQLPSVQHSVPRGTLEARAEETKE